MAALSELLQRIVNSFPQTGLSTAIAYGSGVFKQTINADMRRNMIDFILVVSDPHAWHAENLQLNRRHYSFMRHLAAPSIARVQDIGPGVYYNTLVKFEDGLIKYGVVSETKLITDMLDWEYLYLAGRLHKPVNFLRNDSPRIRLAQRTNIENALHASLLLLPDQFTEFDLFSVVANLSYRGDFRMLFGEDKNKVANIVRPGLSLFRGVYESALLAECRFLHWHREAGTFEQDAGSHQTRYHHLNLLPRRLVEPLVRWGTRDGRMLDTEEIFSRVAASPLEAQRQLVSHAAGRIVCRSSLVQSGKGVLTGGLAKSARYAMGKIAKQARGARASKRIPLLRPGIFDRKTASGNSAENDKSNVDETQKK